MFAINIPLPESCYHCPLSFMSYDNDEEEFCVFWAVRDPIQNYDDQRHPNCPLLQVEDEETKKRILKENNKDSSDTTKED